MDPVKYIDHELEGLKSLEDLRKYIHEKFYFNQIVGVRSQEIDLGGILRSNHYLTVDNIVVGNVNNHMLWEYSKDLLQAVDDQLHNFNFNRHESLIDKILILKDWKENCLEAAEYFDPSNPIQFMSKVRFWLEMSGNTSEFPFVKIKLTATQSEYLARAISLRRELFEAIYLRVKNLYDELAIRYQGPKKYELKSANPQFDLMELYIALISSNSMEFIEGDKETFLMDLFNLFNVEPGRIADTKSKILERVTRAKFLDRLALSLENAEKSRKKET